MYIDYGRYSIKRIRNIIDTEEIQNMYKFDNKDFYNNFKEDAKLYKGYILTATDGSDFEIPNTVKTRKNYNSTKNNESVA